ILITHYLCLQHRTTKYSPYQLLYGKDPVLPFDIPQSMVQFARSNDYYNQFRGYRFFLIQQTQERIRQQQQSTKQRYDQHRQNIQYQYIQIQRVKEFYPLLSL
ncbi:unnamed protein product, partial [Didymodactylos carnosus]